MSAIWDQRPAGTIRSAEGGATPGLNIETREQAEAAIRDLTERLHNAHANLLSMSMSLAVGSKEGQRLKGKAEGVRLALEYISDVVR